MNDQKKSKAQLIAELQALRAEMHQLQKAPKTGLEHVIFLASTRLVGLEPEKMNQAIDDILGEIGRFTEVDRSYVFLASPDKFEFSNTHEWCRAGIEPQIEKLQNLPISDFPWFFKKLDTLENIYIPRVSLLPVEAAAEKKSFTDQGIKSLICVPLIHSGKLLGFTGFDSVTQEREWQEEEIRLLHILADNIASDLARKSAEEALSQERRLLRTVIDNLPVSVYIKDLQGRKILANRVDLEIMGLSDSDVLGKTDAEIFPSATAEHFDVDDQVVIQQGIAIHNHEELGFNRSTGKEFWQLTSKAPLYDADGKIIGLVGIGLDISDRKRTEEELLDSQALFRSLVESMPQNVFSKDLQGRFTFANRKHCETDGKTLEDFLGKTDFDLYPYDLAVKYRADDLLVIQSEKVSEREEEHQPLGGEKTYVQVVKAPVYNSDNQVKGLLGIFWDITERKKAEEARNLLQARMRRQQENLVTLALHPAFNSGEIKLASHYLTESISRTMSVARVGIWLRGGNNNREMHCQDVYSNITGTHSQGDVISARDFPYYFDALEFERAIDASDVRNDLRTAELYDTYLNPRGITSLLDAAIRLSGQLVGMVCLEHVGPKRIWQSDEIAFAGEVADQMAQALANAERHRVEAEIRQLNAELEQRVMERTAQLEAANKELEAFSYSVSHDLRAPLRGIDGWSQIILEEYASVLDDQGKIYLSRVRGEVQRMGQLINGLLQLSRLTRVGMRYEIVNLSQIAKSVMDRLLSENLGRRIQVEIEQKLDVQGDPYLLEIALTNLLENAFKYTSKRDLAIISFGQIDLEGKKAFFVQDNGAGFDMKYSQKLFVAFQRMHRDTEFPGTGIGLATVQRIIHRHGGQIWVQTIPEQGATFYFTLGQE